MTYTAVPRLRTVDAIVANLQAMIVDRTLAPGDALPSERDLAIRLEVSRSILREALGVLAQRGLVEVRQGSGTYVSAPGSESASDALRLLLQMDRVSLVQLCDARLLIEPEMARLAALSVSSERVDILQGAFNALGVAGDAESHVQADLAFHDAIAEASGHTVLRAIVTAVREPVTRGMLTGAGIEGAVSASDEQHRAVLDAIVAGDAPGAEAAMRNHLEYVREYLAAGVVTGVDWEQR